MVTLIGNSLNSTNKKILDKMNKMDFLFIKKESQAQLNNGAEYIELNAGSLLDNELLFLIKAVKVIEDLGGKVLVRSRNINTLKKIAEVAQNDIILGDIEFDKKKIDDILEVSGNGKVKIVALIKDNGKAPLSPEKSLLIAQHFVDYLLDKGVNRDDILLDPMISSLEESCDNGKKFLDTLELFKLDFPRVKTIAHLIDLSEGLPKRQLISAHFVSLAIEKGLDYVSLNTLEETILQSVITTLSIIGKDKNMQSYINFCRSSRESKKESQKDE